MERKCARKEVAICLQSKIAATRNNQVLTSVQGEHSKRKWKNSEPPKEKQKTALKGGFPFPSEIARSDQIVTIFIYVSLARKPSSVVVVGKRGREEASRSLPASSEDGASSSEGLWRGDGRRSWSSEGKRDGGGRISRLIECLAGMLPPSSPYFLPPFLSSVPARPAGSPSLLYLCCIPIYVQF